MQEETIVLSARLNRRLLPLSLLATLGLGTFLVGALLVATAFSVVTIASMMALVLAGRWGLEWLPAQRLARYNHVLAGGTIALSGVMIRFLGL